MGITEQGVEFLLSARRSGVSFERTVTIGRQFLLASPDRLAGILELAGSAGQESAILPRDHDGFAEPLFHHLGAQELCSVDASDFEGATYSHDLNTPLPSSLSERFSSVVDAGSLEHIFDFPTAMRNCMQMVSDGGHLLCISPVNNAPGHGFYQFSPELFFRILGPENGFAVEQMLLAEVRPGATWYRVVDPAVVGKRIEFRTKRQAYLYVQARKLADRPLLVAPPMQSDYRLEWDQRHSGNPTAADEPRSAMNGVVKKLKATARRNRAIHVSVRNLRGALGQWRQDRHPLDRRYFEPLGRRLP